MRYGEGSFGALCLLSPRPLTGVPPLPNGLCDGCVRVHGAGGGTRTHRIHTIPVSR